MLPRGGMASVDWEQGSKIGECGDGVLVQWPRVRRHAEGGFGTWAALREPVRRIGVSAMRLVIEEVRPSSSGVRAQFNRRPPCAGRRMG